MWIAKPVRELDALERASWNGVLAHAASRGEDAPLAQSLAWARAIDALSGRAFAVFSPDESAGGIVFATADAETRGLRFECVNGPLLAWDDPRSAPRQLATFAIAVARLHPAFRSLSLRPRWDASQLDRRLASLPVAPCGVEGAATLKIALSPGSSEAEKGFDARLVRTLRRSERAGAEARWEDLDRSAVADFAPRMAYFGRKKGFAVPPVAWFLALTSQETEDGGLRFGIVRAHAPGSGCELLVALHGSEAHYLFGHEWREASAPAAVSPAAVAHRLAIRECAARGMLSYDFNGFIESPSEGHPYAGVCAFKAQFGASLVRYRSPEFRIQP